MPALARAVRPLPSLAAAGFALAITLAAVDAEAVDYPVVSDAGSCEAAQAAYVEELGKRGMPPDLSQGALGQVLNQGTYLAPCDVPEAMALALCVAVQNGRAVGVTVTSRPADTAVQACVRTQVMGLSFPSHPRLDIAKTTFAPKEADEPRRLQVESRPDGDAAAPPPVQPARGCGCAIEGRASRSQAVALSATLLGVAGLALRWRARRRRFTFRA